MSMNISTWLCSSLSRGDMTNDTSSRRASYGGVAENVCALSSSESMVLCLVGRCASPLLTFTHLTVIGRFPVVFRQLSTESYLYASSSWTKNLISVFLAFATNARSSRASDGVVDLLIVFRGSSATRQVYRRPSNAPSWYRFCTSCRVDEPNGVRKEVAMPMPSRASAVQRFCYFHRVCHPSCGLANQCWSLRVGAPQPERTLVATRTTPGLSSLGFAFVLSLAFAAPLALLEGVELLRSIRRQAHGLGIELATACARLTLSISAFSVSHVVNRAPLRTRCCFNGSPGNSAEQRRCGCSLGRTRRTLSRSGRCRG